MDKKIKFSLISLTIFLITLTIPSFARQPANLSLLKSDIRKYYSQGEWEKDVKAGYAKARQLLSSFKGDKSKAVIVMDIDETALTSYPYFDAHDFAFEKPSPFWYEWVLKAEAPAIKPALEFYKEAKKSGFKVYFLTGRGELFRHLSEKNLKNEGFTEFDGLIHKSPDIKYRTMSEFKIEARRKIEKSGLRIYLNIGDQESDLQGGYSEHTILLPNPIYNTI